MVFFVALQVFGQAFNFFGKKSNLNFGRACIAFVNLEFINQFLLLFWF